MVGMAAAVWRYRAFVLSSVGNELDNSFACSRLGTLWLLIQPLV